MLNFTKVVMAINYFARNSRGKSINKLDVLKLIYLADRYHLRKFGRSITGERYFAMRMGPVPSKAKNICNQSDVYLTKEEKAFVATYLSFDDKSVHSHKGESSCFCESEREALDVAFSTAIAVRKKEKLTDFTHHFPEWKKYEGKIKGPNDRAEMDIIDFFLPVDNDSHYEYCHISSKLLNYSKEDYQESVDFESFIDCNE